MLKRSRSFFPLIEAEITTSSENGVLSFVTGGRGGFDHEPDKRQRMAHSRMYLESIHLKVFKNDGWHWVSESSVGSVWVCVASRVAWALSGRVMRVSLCVPWPSWLDECGCLDKRAVEGTMKVVTKTVMKVTTEVYL